MALPWWQHHKHCRAYYYYYYYYQNFFKLLHCMPEIRYFVLWANVLSDEQSSELSPFDNHRSSFHVTFTAIHWRRAFVKHRRTWRRCTLCWKVKMEAGAYTLRLYTSQKVSNVLQCSGNGHKYVAFASSFSSVKLKEIWNLGFELHQNAFGGLAPPGPAGGAIVIFHMHSTPRYESPVGTLP